MSDVVIRAEGLGKKYVIGHESAGRERYTALRDVIARQARGLARSASDLIRGRPNVAGGEVEDFWALKDVNFEIRRGDIVGVIGRNGAGKSTLLKVLSRITEPSEGRVTIEGRVASLLEVGTGFHPELTGRENIFLNGAVLGMGRAEIKRKFDEIVAFAEVEKFLDTPVKRYSSGMYVRLAFAVSAHLEPEILVVDEVLAVGDAEFQKKCLGKMQDVAGEGRTVLFVSHNMDAIERLCQKALTLQGGRVTGFKPTRDAVRSYLEANELADLDSYRGIEFRKSSEFLSVDFSPETSSVVIHLRPADARARDVSLVLHDSRQVPLFSTHLSDLGGVLRVSDELVLAAELPISHLRSGLYFVSVAIFDPPRSNFFDIIRYVPIEITSTKTPSPAADSRWGPLYFPIRWCLGSAHEEA